MKTIDLTKLPLEYQLKYHVFYRQISTPNAKRYALSAYYLALLQLAEAGDKGDYSPTLASALSRVRRSEKPDDALAEEIAGYEYELIQFLDQERIHNLAYKWSQKRGYRRAAEWFELIKEDIAEQDALIAEALGLCRAFGRDLRVIRGQQGKKKTVKLEVI
jgi:hypothetical protein